MILGTITLGLEVSMIVMCITIHKLSNGSFVFFLPYVDEMLIAAKILIDINMSRTLYF